MKYHFVSRPSDYWALCAAFIAGSRGALSALLIIYGCVYGVTVALLLVGLETTWLQALSASAVLLAIGALVAWYVIRTIMLTIMRQHGAENIEHELQIFDDRFCDMTIGASLECPWHMIARLHITRRFVFIFLKDCSGYVWPLERVTPSGIERDVSERYAAFLKTRP
ncbi:MAG: hypothetical protein KF861_03475 [Planctomycetaceae bacterium]|nr:hypothetical protein [Planctomycetaceae bacterium]